MTKARDYRGMTLKCAQAPTKYPHIGDDPSARFAGPIPDTDRPFVRLDTRESLGRGTGPN
jgi:hypothetical protein